MITTIFPHVPPIFPRLSSHVWQRLTVPGRDEAPEVLRGQGPGQRHTAAAPDLGHLLEAVEHQISP